jgi:hypothetical protein
MEDFIDLSLADIMGYRQVGPARLTVTSPKQQRSNPASPPVEEPEFHYSSTNFASPPMMSSSAFDFDQVQVPAPNHNLQLNSPRVTSPRASNMNAKTPKKSSPDKKNADKHASKHATSKHATSKPNASSTSPPDAVDVREFRKLEKSVLEMKKYIKLWVRREGLTRVACAKHIQRLYRGWAARRSVGARNLSLRRKERSLSRSKGSKLKTESAYFDSMDKGDAPIQNASLDPNVKVISMAEYNNLRAEVRASTEIAAVAKFHVTQVQDENAVLKSRLEKYETKFKGLEDVVHLLLKEVAHLSGEDSKQLEKVSSDQGSVASGGDSGSSSVVPPASIETMTRAKSPPLMEEVEDKEGRWIETLDPKTGLVYYFNEFTHETKWLPPEEGVVSRLDPGVLAAAAQSPAPPSTGRDSLTPISKPAWQRAGDDDEDEDEEDEDEDGGARDEEEEERVAVKGTPVPLVGMRTAYADNNSPLFSPASGTPGYGVRKDEVNNSGATNN